MSQPIVTPTKTIPHPGKSALRRDAAPAPKPLAENDAAKPESPVDSDEPTTTAPRRRANRDQE